MRISDWSSDVCSSDLADAPLREHVPDTPIRLPDNPLTEPDLAAAERHEVTFGGGMMSGMMGGGRRIGGMMRSMRHNGVWTINGVSASGHGMEDRTTGRWGQRVSV